MNKVKVKYDLGDEEMMMLYVILQRMDSTTKSTKGNDEK